MTTADRAERRWAEPNLAPTPVKRQHYVPRTYLRAFADASERLRVHDLLEDTAFTASTTKVAVGKGFYDLEALGMVLSTEGWLAGVESEAAPVLTRLIETPGAVAELSTDEEFALARFLVALHLRVPAFRERTQSMTDDIVANLKDMTKKMLDGGTFGVEGPEADALWELWQSKPDHWWLGQDQPYTDPELTADLLEETQGFANLLRVKPWRVGVVPEGWRLYTSDNPMSAWLTPIRPWWEPGALTQLDFWVPLSPRVLLRLGRKLYQGESNDELRPQGPREYRDFTAWDTSFARHVVTYNATRFLFGGSYPVDRACAVDCLRRMERGMLYAAAELFGFDPRPPRFNTPPA